MCNVFWSPIAFLEIACIQLVQEIPSHQVTAAGHTVVLQKIPSEGFIQGNDCSDAAVRPAQCSSRKFKILFSRGDGGILVNKIEKKLKQRLWENPNIFIHECTASILM